MKYLSRNINILLLIIFGGIFLISCEEKVEEPEIIEFSVDTQNQVSGEPVNFTVKHTGTHAVLWTGEPGSNYEAYQEQIKNQEGEDETNIVRNYDSGIPVEDTYMKRYSATGTFEAILIVSNIRDMDSEIKTVSETLEITITEAE